MLFVFFSEINNSMETEAVKVRTRWALDPVHSEVSFKVRHMMIANVTGMLTDYNVWVETDSEDFTHAQVKFTGNLKSVNTGNEQRDAHLRSADFFDVDQNPEVTFQSTALRQNGNHFKIEGNLTIKGVSRPVVLDAEFGGTNKDPWGNWRAGFTVTGKLSRADLGLTWNATLESGGVLVGDEVKINAEIQLIRQVD
jgi:polyisoprenoid-binding protein YceI